MAQQTHRKKSTRGIRSGHRSRSRGLLSYAVAFLVIVLLNFLLPRLMPGEPLEAIYGDDALLNMSVEMKAAVTERFKLDQPVAVQFWAYLTGVAAGDLGESYYHGEAVSKVISNFLPWTLLLMGGALCVSLIFGFVMGIEAGWKRGKWIDRVLVGGNVLWLGFPGFFIGAVLMILLGVKAGVFPIQGGYMQYSGLEGTAFAWDVVWHAVLPVMSLTLVFLPGYFFLARSGMIMEKKEPYIGTALAKGLKPWVVRYRHGGRNAAVPIVTAFGAHLASRITMGALLVEVVFSYPGMGTLIYQSLQNRDYPVLQGALLVVTVLVLSVNFLVDLWYRRVDPRGNDAY